MFKHFSLSHLSAGFIAVLVGYSSSAVIIFQAAATAGADAAQISSWLWALGLGMAASSIGLSLHYRAPVLTAWSTPGAALLVTALAGLSPAEAVGAFLLSSLLITLCGVFGLFDRIMQHVPRALAGAMLAGVLLRFGLDFTRSLQADFGLVATMFALYLGGRRLLPRYAVPLALAGGLVFASLQGAIRFDDLRLEFARPVFTAPEFSISALIGVGLPLFVVTMASQNLPGLTVLRANGYRVPASPLVAWTGITGLLLAPFGGFAYNLAAITAAICMSKDADPDPARRYLAAVWAGGFYLATGIFGATVAGLFAAFPRELILAIAGLALLGTIGNSLAAALEHEAEREPALITFLTTASGITLAGIGSAFWGLVLGLLTLYVSRLRRPAAQG